MPRKGHVCTPEMKAKVTATRAANRAKMGSKVNRRATESKVEESAGDADYCISTTGRVRPHFNKHERGWDN